MKTKASVRIILVIVMIIACMAALGILSACGGEKNSDEKRYTEGLIFELNTDGNGYIVTGRGTAEDVEISIPPYYEGMPVTGIAERAFATNISAEDAYEEWNMRSRYSFEDFMRYNSHYYIYPVQNCEDIIKVVIPDTVTEIGNEAFYEDDHLQDVIIGNKVLSIGRGSFCKCTELTSIDLPEGLKEVGALAFYKCPLKEIVIPSSLSVIEVFAFAGCDAEKIIINEGVEEIQEGAFYMNNIKEITLPASLNTVKAGAFKDCKEIETVYYSGTREEYKEMSFARYTGLEAGFTLCYGEERSEDDLIGEGYTQGLMFGLNDAGDGYILIGRGRATDVDIVIPPYFRGLPVTEINEKAFFDYPSPDLDEAYRRVLSTWMTLTVPSFVNYSVSWIKESEMIRSPLGFISQKCDDIESIVMPDTITKIGQDAIHKYENLKKVVFSKNLTNTGSVLSYLESYLDLLEDPSKGEIEVVIYEGLVEIGDGFLMCTSIKEFTIPSTVKIIGKWAFMLCHKIETVVIPDGVERIESEAFSSCQSLKEVYLPASVRFIGQGAFNNNQTVTIYYSGTEEDFNAIEIESPQTFMEIGAFKNAEIVFLGVEEK